MGPTSSSSGCCPPFDPSTWQDKEIVWEDKPFVREHVHSLFHIPLDMGRKITHGMRMIEEAHAAPSQALMLTDDRSPWRSELYLDVAGPVPGADVVKISGKFLTRVYEGPFRDIPKWIDHMKAHVTDKGKAAEKIYIAYTTCPSCAKAYGKNYVVLFADLGE